MTLSLACLPLFELISTQPYGVRFELLNKLYLHLGGRLEFQEFAAYFEL